MNRVFISTISFVFLVGIAVIAWAKVTGPCSNCHTMHNSQGGIPMALELNVGQSGFVRTGTPNPTLLIKGCVGCHTFLGEDTVVDGVPIVFNITTIDPTNALAGGNFKYVKDSDANGHNVLGITGPDSTFQSKSIPGSSTGYYLLACAGAHGCHGDRGIGDELQAVKGAHHANDPIGIDGSSVGLSYRFLYGILGKEDDDWEKDNTNTSHNEYKGSSSSTLNTISYLCAECHGNYHTWEGGSGEVGTASPWFRHPTDIKLKNDGEYAEYTTYSMVAPVARPDPYNAIAGVVTPGTDIVMCLSCHRAHGSQNYKLMRWDYRGWPYNGEENGCSVCHTWKD